MPNPTLSIITLSYNQADYIERCLQSVCDQNYDDVEHIVVDGGSTDGTVDILKRCEDKYNLQWVSEPDDGQSDAINKGIQMANGKWIGWQNSDDFYYDGAFEYFRKGIQKYPSADFLYGDVIVIDENGREQRRLLSTRPSMFQHKYWSMYARNQSAFFKSTVFDKVGYLNENLDYAMDAEFFKRILESDLCFVHIPAVLGAYRDHENAKTHGQFSKQQEREWNTIYDHNIIEVYVPTFFLKMIGRVIKSFNLLSDRILTRSKFNRI